ncbi:MAG: permease [Candidatus Coatesbacteria bacterium]|nr:permease [Candidatus Coatesbacteria bacterium]
MLMPTIVMGAIALILLIVGIYKGQGQHITAIKYGGSLMLQIIPLLLFAFFVAGMIQELIPQKAISHWVGSESGLRGIIIGTIAGGFTPGGPYVSLPIIAGLIKSGASIGTIVAFLTAWSLWAIARLPLEIGILGYKFTIIRVACTFFFPPLAGLLAQFLFANYSKGL